jgi:excisionase family DNA binding protein
VDDHSRIALLRERVHGMSDLLLYTPAQAAQILKVPESWLRKKAAARVIPCTFVGKHLRFSSNDLSKIVDAGARRPREHHNAPAHHVHA